MSDDEPGVKRQRVFRACAQCVNGKTRCEEVTAAGCRSCRRKQKACSLLSLGLARPLPTPQEALPLPQVASPQVPVADLLAVQTAQGDRIAVQENVITTLETRIALLESQLSNLTCTPLTSSPPFPSTSYPTYPNFNPLVENPPVYRFSDSIINVSSSYHTPFFPDVVALGLLRRDQVDMAFHLCKHRMHEHIPLDYFASSATPTPNHPFIVLAILQHVPSILTPAILAALDESINLVLAGLSDVDIVLGLLILALAPASPGDKARIAPHRLASLAYDICIDLGLHQMINFDETRKSVIDGKKIWPIVQQKHILLNCIRNGRVNSAVRELSLTTIEPLVELVLTNSRLLEYLETRPNRVPEEDEFYEHYADVLKRWTSFTATCKGPDLGNALCAQFMLSMRYSAYIHAIPSPFADPKKRLYENMGSLPPVLRGIMALVIDGAVTVETTPTSISSSRSMQQTSLPAYLATAAASATICMRHAAIYIISQFRHLHNFVDLDELEHAETILHASGGEAARLVGAVIENMGPVSNLLPTVDQVTMPDPPVDLTAFLDFFNWDMSTVGQFGQPTISGAI